MDQEERLGGKMNRLELTKALVDAGISDQSVRFSDANDHYCLVKKGDAWVVYFIERGEETYFRSFSSEHEACMHLYEILIIASKA
ncbi:MAG: hypothetical protein ING21_09965 [Burkholderiales bacterium]|jgi:hypothetical protein|nr:hypothetical protein [Burkholderiales bacterium]MCA3160683.1 hypothetical protein [Burkholderiales bacterium]MCA3164667.1 hypothetical protein [Burkholderiales bacterium]MCA3166809.1 hypothetical protein [Burkholderiales bacterium]MCA3170879.1 hypothetical protein [Burkholderiales bacterium]